MVVSRDRLHCFLAFARRHRKTQGTVIGLAIAVVVRPPLKLRLALLLRVLLPRSPRPDWDAPAREVRASCRAWRDALSPKSRQPIDGRDRRSAFRLFVAGVLMGMGIGRAFEVYLNKLTSTFPLPMTFPYLSRVKLSCESYEPSRTKYLSTRTCLDPSI
jgi:hypothetical protein